MNLKKMVPADLVAVARLVRTVATLMGLRDPAERRYRLSTLRRMVEQDAQSPNGRRVLVFSFRGWYPHAAWESVLGHALRLRGASVHIFNCGGHLPICEVNFRHARPILACTECAAYPKQLVSALGLARSWLHDYVSLREQREIEETVKQLAPSEYEDWSFQGQAIGSLVRDSVIWFLRKSKPDLNSPDALVYRDFLISGAQIALLAPRLLDATQPDVVIELNGHFFAERIFNHYVDSTTTVVAYEAAWRSNTLGFDRVSEAGSVDLDSIWEEAKDRPLTARESDELDNWIKERSAGDMQRDFYIRFKRADGENPLRVLGLAPNLPTAVLFTNLVWDTAVLGRDLAFPSVGNWLLTTLQLFNKWPHRQLIIRIHPAEDLRPSQESSEKLGDMMSGLSRLPGNIRVVPARQELSSYTLMEHCQVGLVYTSTTGLEMALREKPVVVAGRVYYRNRGFTYDVDRIGNYTSILKEAFAMLRLDKVRVSLARRFAYLLLFRYLHRIPVVHQRPRQLPLLDPGEVELLLPGALPDFDQLLAAFLNGRDFVAVSKADS